MKRVRDAVRRYTALASRLDRAVGRLPDAKKAREMRLELERASSAVDRVAREISGEVEIETSGIPVLTRALFEVAAGRLDCAARRYRALPRGWDKLCVFEAYGRACLARNRAPGVEPSAGDRRALEGLNRYRMALGISPLLHDARLWRAATDHSREMGKHGYLSHESPVPEHRTKELRARKAGYPGSVAENISARGEPKTAIEVWKWDGGHHRTMIAPRYVHAGLGTGGPCVLDVGSGDEKAPPGIRY
jgi:hypothetical protein